MAEFGFKAFSQLSYIDAAPLLDEMFACIQVMPDPRQPIVVREIMEEPADIEEISTRLKLRMEWWKLHTGFLSAAFPSLAEGLKVAGQ